MAGGYFLVLDFFDIWYKHSLGLNDELIRFWSEFDHFLSFLQETTQGVEPAEPEPEPPNILDLDQ